MRKPHSTVVLALLALALAPVLADAQTPAPGGVQFTVFVRGTPVGVEETQVARSADGLVVTGVSRLGPPLDVVVRRAEIRYDASGKPVSCFIEGSLRQRLMVVSATVSGTTATSDLTEGTSRDRRVHEIAPDAVLLPSVYFGGHEVLASRLLGKKTGDEVPAYVPGQGPVTTRIVSASDERIQTASGTVKVRRFQVAVADQSRSVDAEVWVDEKGGLVRFSAATQTIDIVRTDVASVAARREAVPRAGDQSVRIPANGFTLAGTLSRPTGEAPKGTRLPAIVLVGSIGATDREETRAGIPILGQLASALADAGFLVLRYDQRGVGQSGGRAESAEIGDYAEDVRSVVRFLRRHKEVDRDRIALLGYDQGGSVAMTAAARDEDFEALILAATPGMKGTELVLEQQRAALAKMDLPEAEKQRRIDLQARINEAVITGRGWEEIPAGMRRQAESQWFRSLLVFDPAEPMKRLRQPVLVVHGALDAELGSHHAEALAAMAEARKKPAGEKVRLAVVPGVNHLLVAAREGTVDEYASLGGASVDPEVVTAIVAWLGETMPLKKK
jgi:pimeloyl-ACP methyl ester carboxylesterase